ncbi:MAG: hypothetical protein AAFN81_34430, partial [Bacteroidota bacterium]
MKSFIVLSCLALISTVAVGQCASSLFGGCVDVALSVSGTTLSVNFEPTGSISGSPTNNWQSSVLTIRWAETAGGANPITSLTDPAAGGVDFGFGKDFMTAGAPDNEAFFDNGYYYQKFSAVPSPNAIDITTATEIFSVDFTTTETTVTFELVDNTNTFVFNNNGQPSVQRLFGETFNGFSTPTATFSSSPFPVEWLYFNAEAVSSSAAELSWATATESNNDFFQIEKSVDGELFEIIARVQAVGNSTTTQEYDYLDKDFVANKVFYRLKQVDVDGKFTYAEVVEVNFDPALN